MFGEKTRFCFNKYSLRNFIGISYMYSKTRLSGHLN